MPRLNEMELRESSTSPEVRHLFLNCRNQAITLITPSLARTPPFRSSLRRLPILPFASNIAQRAGGRAPVRINPQPNPGSCDPGGGCITFPLRISLPLFPFDPPKGSPYTCASILKFQSGRLTELGRLAR